MINKKYSFTPPMGDNEKEIKQESIIRDDFQRKYIAENVIKLLTDTDVKVSPMIIDGGWGTGKTEFCHKLINLIKCKLGKNAPHLIYIDAFRADHADEPLLTIIAGILEKLPRSKKEKLIKKAIPTIRFGVKLLGKAAVTHVLKENLEDVNEEFRSSIQEATNESIDASIGSILKSHEKADKNLRDLQKYLHKISKEKEIILFIDELDRCRPDFAIKMLEVIKHIFDIEGLQFVLITNTEQLKASIEHRYGSIDANRYLDKFIGFRFRLSEKIDRVYPSITSNSVSFRHFTNLISNIDNLKETCMTQSEHTVLHFLKHMISIHSLSLREVETLVRYITIFQTLHNEAFANNTYPGYLLLRIAGIFTFCFKANIFDDVGEKKPDAKEIIGYLGVSNIYEHADLKAKTGQQILSAMFAINITNESNNFFHNRSPVRKDWESYISNQFMGGSESKKYLDIVRKVHGILDLSEE